MKELKDYTSQELFNELWTREDVIAVKMWTKEDLVEQARVILRNEEPELEKHVEDIADLAMDSNYDCLKDTTNEEWDHVYSQVVDAIEEFKEKNYGKEEEQVSEHTA